MKRFRLILGLTLVVLLAASFVAWYLQPSALDVARRHCAEQGIDPESLAVRGYHGSGSLLGNQETVRFQVRGARSRKVVVVELRQPAYFLPWRVVAFAEEADGPAS